MSNPIYDALNNSNGNLMQQFQKFRNDMKGRDPNAEIQKLLSSGQISQAQLNQAQQMAMQMQNMFRGFMR